MAQTPTRQKNDSTSKDARNRVSGRAARISVERAFDWVGSEAARERLYLIDRLWPAGVKKAELALEGWPKELAPSTELRQRYRASGAYVGKKRLSRREFEKLYREELDARHAAGELDEILPELQEVVAAGHKKLKKKAKKIRAQATDGVKGKKAKKKAKKAAKKKAKKLKRQPVVVLLFAAKEEKTHAGVLHRWLSEHV